MCLGGLAPVPTPVHASVEDITSLQSVKKFLLQLYGIRKATLAAFSTSSLFLVTVTGRAARCWQPVCDRVQAACMPSGAPPLDSIFAPVINVFNFI